MFTFRAQLTFGYKPKEEFNVARLLSRFVFSASDSLPRFSLLPFDDDKGQQVSSIDQLPDNNPEFYSIYYHNHRILQTGNLTGMIQFQCRSSWSELKSPSSSFSRWLKTNKIYLNYTKFKTSTLVPCGFLHGAHPGYLHRDEVEAEIKKYLNIADDLEFQLSSRTISVPVTEGKPEKFSFNAVVVETSVKNAALLRERFYALGDPLNIKNFFPYTGGNQFVPLLKSKEWSVTKIYRLAKVHMQVIMDLKPIFLQNIRDLRNSIGPNFNLRQGFCGMETSPSTGNPIELLLHSIHNTSVTTTKVALTKSALYDDAVSQFSVIAGILKEKISPDYYSNVFTSEPPQVQSQHIDSVSSCNSSSYADHLLAGFNPQDGDNVEIPLKHFRSSALSYATAATTPTAQESTTVQLPSLSTFTDTNIDSLYDKLKERYPDMALVVTNEDLEENYR